MRVRLLREWIIVWMEAEASSWTLYFIDELMNCNKRDDIWSVYIHMILLFLFLSLSFLFSFIYCYC